MPENVPKTFLNPVISSALIFTVLVTLAVELAVPVREGDLWWQMAYGRYLLTGRTLIPDHSIFSWTPAENTLIYCAWIAEIFFYVLYQAGGLFALFGFKYLCFLTFLFLFWHTAVRYRVGSRPLTWLICLSGMLMLMQAAYIKPEIFSLVFMSLTVWSWYYFKDPHNDKVFICYFFPLYVLLWVNSHGAFIFGLTYLGCLGLGEIFNILFSTRQRLPVQKRKHFFISLLLCAVAVFITPYGWEYPSQMFYNLFLGGLKVEHYEMVNAYQSILDRSLWPIHYIDYMFLALAIIIFLLWPSVKKKGLDFTLILSNLVFCWLFIRFLRTTYFWGVVFSFSGLYLLSQNPEPVSPGFRKYINAVIVIICLFLAARTNYESIFKFHPFRWFGFGISYINPVSESGFIKENFSGMRLGNDYDTGGYLLWDLWPETKIFIDPRYFPFRQWFVVYRQFVSGKNPAFLNKFSCDVWCLKLEYPVVNDFLRSRDWRLVHYGPTAAIFVKQGANVPDMPELASSALSSIKSLPQALIAFNFASKINDIDTAHAIIDNLKYYGFVPSHRDFVSQMNNAYGCLLLRNNRPLDAEPYFMKALDLNTEYAEACSNLGALFIMSGKPDEAIKYYKQAIHIEPDNPVLFFSAGMALRSVGDTDSAVRYFKQSLLLNPNQPNVYYLLGDIFIDKDREGAIQYYREALRIKPDFIKALERLGLLYYQAEDYDKALACYKKLIELVPESPASYYNIACLFARKNRADMSIAWLKSAIDKGYNNWENIRTDQDLESIRELPEFQALIESSD